MLTAGHKFYKVIFISNFNDDLVFSLNFKNARSCKAKRKEVKLSIILRIKFESLLRSTQLFFPTPPIAIILYSPLKIIFGFGNNP